MTIQWDVANERVRFCCHGESPVKASILDKIK